MSTATNNASLGKSSDLLSSNLTKPPLAIIALNRMGFGPRPGDVDDFNSLGGNEEESFDQYVDQQINPESIDDSELCREEKNCQILFKGNRNVWL